MSDTALVEVRVEFDEQQAELAALAIGEFSPGGFVEEEPNAGRVAFCVYLSAGTESRLEPWLKQSGVEPLRPPEIKPVPADWDERWKEFHKAVTIGGLWIGPPWRMDEAPDGLKHVIIEPAQGFGTGAHPTTRLMLTLLQNQPRSSVLDLGCGSGVLSVAASMLGFAPITAVDNDPVAVESTRDNIKRNNVPSIKTFVLDALQQDLPVADLVLANILYEPLVRIAPKMKAPRLILSGLLRNQAADCTAAYEKVGYVLREQRERDGWAALVLDNANEHAQPPQNTSIW